MLEATGLTRHYGPIKALDGVDLIARDGTLPAIVGDNGAGKTTTMKILSGALRRDRGDLRPRGESVSFGSPIQARAAGIETVSRELARAPNLGAVANIFLGRELMRNLLRVRLPLATAIDKRQLSGGQRQAVAIARAASRAEARPQGVERRHGRDHDQPHDAHVIQLADHVIVLRHGMKVADRPATGLSTADVVQLIVGDRSVIETT